MPSKKVIDKSLLYYHISYWILFVGLFTFIWGTYDNDYFRNFMVQVLSLPSRLVLVYITILFLFPLLFNKGKIFLFAVWYILVLIGCTVLIQRPMMMYYIEGRYLSFDSTEFFNLIELTNTMLDINVAAIIPIGGKIAGYWIKSKKKLNELQVINQKLSNYQNQFILFKKGSSKHKLFLKDIQYIESLRNHILVATLEKKHDFYGSITNLESVLKDQPFLRIHRSFIVNTNYIESFNTTNVTIDGHDFPIGRKYKENVLKKLRS